MYSRTRTAGSSGETRAAAFRCAGSRMALAYPLCARMILSYCLRRKHVNLLPAATACLTACLLRTYTTLMAELPKAVRAYLKDRARIGGKARAKKLTPARRKAIARKAARVRWAKQQRPSTRRA
jgi:hypothetical protein